MEKNKLEKIRSKCGFSDGICIDSEGHSGGLGMWWRDVDTSLISYSNHHVLVEIMDAENRDSRWFACGIYGWPDRQHKHKTWDLIRTIRRRCRGPLLMFGDFNEILGNHEKEDGNLRPEREMDAFRSCLDECGLQDLGYRGSAFTWSRGSSPSSMIRERLDRFVACAQL